MTGVAGAVLFAVSILFSGSALGQVSSQLTLASDNEFRGNSLSGKKPVVSIDVNIDSASGWFAGGLLSEARFGKFTREQAQAVADVGYAHALLPGLSWEVGATTTAFANTPSYNYSEIFAGLAGSRWSTRIYFASDYYGRELHTLYAEFNYSQPLTDRLRLLGHVGMLRTDFGAVYELDHVSTTNTFDLRLGADVDLGRASMQLSWNDTNRVSYLYPAHAANQSSRWLVSLSYPF